MKKEPVKVSLIGKADNNIYQLKFPKVHIPVNVNEELYHRMLRSSQYEFVQPQSGRRKNHHSSVKEMLSV